MDAALSVSAPVFGRFSRLRLTLIVAGWIAAALLVGYMAYAGPTAWDAQVYWKAMQSVHRGGDPYAEGIAAQRAFHDRAHPLLVENSPFTYVYSPMTLPLLRSLATFPVWLLCLLYGVALVAGVLLQLWAGMQMADERERRSLVLVLPFVALFPGLLMHDVIMSANLAYILYGMVLVAAVPGWKRDRWSWFYIAVLIASIFKAPLLTLLAFPILVGRRQWFPAAISGAAGLLLFAASARLWPRLFHEYMRAVFLQFEWNHDFGFSPSGLLGSALYDMGKHSSSAPTVLYLIFAGVLGGVLLYVAYRVRQGQLSREIWIPVALLGTILANPRIKEYDVAAITIPMLLIGQRALRGILNHLSGEQAELSGTCPAQRPSGQVMLLAGSGWFLVFILLGIEDWKSMELGLMFLLFGLGIWSLYQHRRETSGWAASVEAPAAINAESLQQLKTAPQRD